MPTRLETKVHAIEKWIEKTAYAQWQYQMKLDKFHDEIQEFKDDTQLFKDEVREFKEDTQRFKDEMREYKEDTQRFKDEVREYKESGQRFHDDTNKFIEEQKRERREMNRKWGELANKMGTIVEDIVLPNLPGILRKHFGVDEAVMTAPRIKRRHPEDRSRVREFDAVVVTEDGIFVNETKSSLRMSDIERFDANYREVIEYFPEHAQLQVVPIMSALYIEPTMLNTLTERGIFAMGLGDENMELLNATELGRPATEQTE